MHNKSFTSSTIASSSNLHSAGTRTKDTPTVWAMNAFDPDDETLPSIDEVSRDSLQCEVGTWSNNISNSASWNHMKIWMVSIT